MSTMIYSNDSFITELNEKFEGFAFEYDEVKYNGVIPVFFIRVNCNEESFSKQWPRIVDFIGVYFQTSLQNEFAIWNLYLFFIVEKGINDSLKYQIENNTFSSRKIIIESEMSNQNIIKEHIINSDLLFGNEAKQSMVFEHNVILWKYLKGKEAKRKITEEDKTTFKRIITTIKKQSNED